MGGRKTVVGRGPAGAAEKPAVGRSAPQRGVCGAQDGPGSVGFSALMDSRVSRQNSAKAVVAFFGLPLSAPVCGLSAGSVFLYLAISAS